MFKWLAYGNGALVRHAVGGRLHDQGGAAAPFELWTCLRHVAAALLLGCLQMASTPRRTPHSSSVASSASRWTATSLCATSRSRCGGRLTWQQAQVRACVQLCVAGMPSKPHHATDSSALPQRARSLTLPPCRMASSWRPHSRTAAPPRSTLGRCTMWTLSAALHTRVR